MLGISFKLKCYTEDKFLNMQQRIHSLNADFKSSKLLAVIINFPDVLCFPYVPLKECFG